jgi:pimeloyl-ACP methyl ester carboxylesterase
MSTVRLNDITIGYDDTGGDLPLLLVHGHPFDRTMWRPQLALGYRMIAPDLRGYGESTVVPGKTAFAVFAADLAALLDHLAVDRAVVVGLSMGGQIALEFLRLHADRVRALVLADTSPRAETPEGVKYRTDLADTLLRDGSMDYIEHALPKMVVPGCAAEEHVRRMMTGAPVEGSAAALRGRAERPDYVDLLAQANLPTLIVVGDRDEYTPVAEAQFMHGLAKGSRLAVIAGAAHLPNLERPVEFNATLQSFVDEL